MSDGAAAGQRVGAASAEDGDGDQPRYRYSTQGCLLLYTTARQHLILPHSTVLLKSRDIMYLFIELF